MSLSLGIVGLPNVGKSTLFNALLKRQASLVANYPFATIEPNMGVVDVPDTRISRLIEIAKNDYGQRVGDREVPEKVVPATIKFYDIAGLVKGASAGEGLGNAFLGHIREVDAIVHVVRDFIDPNIIRAGSVDPQSDEQVINTELLLSDLQLVEKRLSKMDKKDPAIDTITKLKAWLDTGNPALTLDLGLEERKYVDDLKLLTAKPTIIVYNVDESVLGKTPADKICISAKIESEIASINDPQERQEFLQSLGIKESGLDQIIRQGYKTLGLETFFTVGPKEVHAWTIKQGSTAPQAAGRIHTDFERGFISAEIVSYADLDKTGSLKQAKTLGLLRLEGKEYAMKDGDTVEFNFSV